MPCHIKWFLSILADCRSKLGCAAYHPRARRYASLRSAGVIRLATAAILVAEIGPDVSAFPTAGHLRSWAGLCPRLIGREELRRIATVDINRRRIQTKRDNAYRPVLGTVQHRRLRTRRALIPPTPDRKPCSERTAQDERQQRRADGQLQFRLAPTQTLHDYTISLLHDIMLSCMY